MTAPFIHELSGCLAGAVCLVGLGNSDLSDDGFGIWMVNAAARHYFLRDNKDPHALDIDDHCKIGNASFLIAGRTPEKWMPFFSGGGFDHVIFFDAVNIGKPPGTVIWLNSSKIKESCDSISTHKLSLNTITQLIEGACFKTQVWLLGVQPCALISVRGLSKAVVKTAEMLDALFEDLLVSKPNAMEMECAGGPA
jgi:hydrogenase maturation protease